MSSSTDHLAALESSTERRFYPRIAPLRPLYVAFGDNNLGMLLNVGENGLLVSTPSDLELNSFFRITLELNSIVHPIDVNVRIVWTSAPTKRAGVQFIDLSEYDREQLRKWSALQLDQQQGVDSEFTQDASISAPETLAPAPEPASEFGKSPEYAFGPSCNPPLPTITPADFGFPLPQDTGYLRRRRKRSAVPKLLAWGAVAAVLCLAAAMFLNPGFARQLMQRSSELGTRIANAAYVAPSPDTPSTPSARGTPAAAHSTAPAGPSSTVVRSSPPPSGPDVPPSTARPPRPAALAAYLDDSSSDSSETSGSFRHGDSKPFPFKANAPAVPVRPAETAAPSTATATSGLPTAVTSPLPGSEAMSATSAPVAPVPATKPAVAGSLGNSNPSRAANAATAVVTPTPQTSPTSSTSSSSSWASSKTPVSAGRSSFFHLRAGSGVVQTDPSSGRVTEISPPRGFGSSFVNLPGERILDSPAVTVHIQRSVLISADHWVVLPTHKKVAVGELTSHVDPQLSSPPTTTASVTVQATIDKDGYVRDIKPLAGSFAFLPSVAKAVREWRYEPTYIDSKPVETRAQIEVDFHAPSHR
jgi:PilZ domain/Gram-negative bacterial TonB protein C-terminal